MKPIAIQELSIESPRFDVKLKTVSEPLLMKFISKMSNIYVYSTTPNWKITNDIRNTRLKDLEKGEIIYVQDH